jgi:hypothetical protein
VELVAPVPDHKKLSKKPTHPGFRAQKALAREAEGSVANISMSVSACSISALF